MLETEPEKDKKNDLWWRPALMLFFQLSGWIAFPIIIAIFLGTWLDEKYGTGPWLFLTTVGMSFVISIIGIVRESTKAIKTMESFGNKNKNNKKLKENKQDE